MDRRNFLSSTLTAAAGVSTAAATSLARLPIRKGILLSMLPPSMPHVDRFKLALDCGWQSMECGTETNPATADLIKEASVKTGMPIHSVMNAAHWQFPLNSPDAAVVEKSLEGMRTSLRNAKLWGADTVLLVPAVVNADLSYQEAWTRSQAQVKKLIPLAAELKVVIGIENVWNKFLLSPMEMANYVDSFNSPWVKAYFDVGNILLYGFPQDWIRTLGKRICKVHLKDFSFRNNPQIKKRVADFVNLREGDLDWKAVHKALAEIGYKGDATVELPRGDEAYLKDLSSRVDMILEGA